MRNWKRLLVLVAFTTAIGVASFAVEEEVNAQTAGSAGSGPSPTAGTSSGGSSSTPTAGTGSTTTPSTSTEEKKDSGGCSVAAPASDAGIGALVGLALGLALWRRRKD